MAGTKSEEPTARELIGRSAEVVFSDPWEFARPDGTTRFSAAVTALEAMADDAERDGVLIRLDEQIKVKGQDASTLLVRGRRGPGLLRELSLGAAIQVTFLVRSCDHADTGSPFDDEAWRGGLAAVGTFELRYD